MHNANIESVDNKIIEDVFVHGKYIKHWRKVFKPTFNKKYTMKLAKAIKTAYPKFSLYQAKVFTSQYKWYDYYWLCDYLVRFFDKDLANKLCTLLDYIDNGGKTRYELVNSPEYEKALSDWFDELHKYSETLKDGSILMDPNKVPRPEILNIYNRKQMETETRQELSEFGQLLSDWIFNSHQDLMISIFDAWRHTYIRYCYNADGYDVFKQMSWTINAIKHNDQEKTAKLLADYFAGWWD